MKENSIINQKLPLPKLGVLGLQHVLVMYSSSILVPLILGGALGLSSTQLAYLVSADIFTCGIATLLQVIGIGKFAGIRLPVMLGCTLMTIPPMIAIGKADGITAIYGAIIVSGIFIFLLSFSVLDKLIKFFPPLVTGCLITVVGFSLTRIAIIDVAGGFDSPSYGSANNFILALVVIISILVINKFFEGFTKAVSVLIGLVVGTLVAYFMGMVNFEPVHQADWFHIITPFYFGLPKFTLDGSLAMMLVMLMAVVESIGIFMIIGQVCEVKLDVKDITKGVRAEGIAQVIGGVFNSFPYMTFSENAGLMEITGVRSRYVIISSGVILIALGTLPKFAAMATIIPAPVLGSAMVAIFGMIGIAGTRMLLTVDLSGNSHNLLIAACSIGTGIGISVVPDLFSKMPQFVQLIAGNGIFMAAFVAIFLNIFFNYDQIKNQTKNPENEL